MANCDSNFTQESTGGASGTVAGLRTYKWCYVDTAVKDCAVNCGWHEFELDAKGNKVVGTEKYIDKDGNEFTLPLASTIQERECPIVPAEPPPVPPEELTFIGKDCDDVDVPVTGLEGQIVQVVQATDTVFKVQLCDNAKDIEHWILCDKVSGDKVAVIVDYSTIPPVTSYWDIITNSAWTGDPKADLEQCSGTDLESDKITMCDNGTTFYRWIVKSNGEPTGDYFDTNLTGAPYTPTGTVTEGTCKICEPTISSATADSVGTLLAGNSISVQKNNCCSIKVKTSAGDFIISKDVTGYSTSNFSCAVTVSSVEILSGTCSLSNIIVTTQFNG
jgi:hypothetical protein